MIKKKEKYFAGNERNGNKETKSNVLYWYLKYRYFFLRIYTLNEHFLYVYV